MPAVALTFVVAAGCGAGGGHAGVRAPIAAAPARPRPAAPKIAGVPAWTYWQPVETPIVEASSTDAAELPVSVADLTRLAGSGARWDDAPSPLRETVLLRGFAVVRQAQPSERLGDFYAALADDHVPFVVTLDALFFLAHLAFDRALADLDTRVLAPMVAAMVQRVDARLAAESRGATADVGAAYAIARGLLAAPPADASLLLEGAGERNAHTHVDVATARAHARAALLLSRALADGVDPEASNAWRRVERLSELLLGGSEDISPRDLAAAAASAELDVRSAEWVGDVVSVDRVRHRAAGGRAVSAFRLFGLRSTPDAELLQALTFPAVGTRFPLDAPMTWAPSEPTEPCITARDGVRALPTALDVAAWLGSAEARSALRESGDDAYDRYDETLERLARARPTDGAFASAGRHATPYLSMIDAIETWLAPSAGDAVQPASTTADWRKRKAEVALAAWTELRHDATSQSRAQSRVSSRVQSRASGLAPRTPAEVTAPTFVEPHPEAIAKLLGFVRQTSRALSAEGGLPGDASSLAILDEVDDLLWTALGAAVYQSADAPLPALLEGTLAAFPERLRGVEGALAESGAAEVPLAVGVHVDVPSGRILEEGTGRIDEAWMVMRQPGTHRLWLALGASIPHDELVQPAAQRLTDTEWRARLRSGGEPPPGPLARSYVQVAAREPLEPAEPPEPVDAPAP